MLAVRLPERADLTGSLPAAEVEVSADLVLRLLAGQHPDLARLPVEFLANGWGNELYRSGTGPSRGCRGAP